MARLSSRRVLSDSIFASLKAVAGVWEAAGRLPGLARNQRGGVISYVALCLPVLVGFGGLAVDVSSWYAKHRLGQAIVDAATLGGSAELARLGPTATYDQIAAAALETATLNGYDPADGQDLQVNWPPQNGPFTGDPNFVEGVFTAPGQNFFSRIFTDDGLTIRNRAVATMDTPDGQACIYGLSTTAKESVRIIGNATVNIDCAIHGNGPFAQGGNSCAAASAVYYVDSGSASCLVEYDGTDDPQTPLEMTPSSPIADPFQVYLSDEARTHGIDNLYDPPGQGCVMSGNNVIEGGDDASSAVVLTPGKYCGDLAIHGHVVFESGFYKIESGALQFNAQSNSQVMEVDAAGTPIAGTEGAPISFHIDSGQKNDSLTINGGAVMNFTAFDENAPEITAGNGDYDGAIGVLFMQTGDYNATLKINGGTTVILDGIVYAPDSEIQYNGNADLEHSNLTIVGDTVDINGNSTFLTGALGSGAGNPAFDFGSRLVE